MNPCSYPSTHGPHFVVVIVVAADAAVFTLYRKSLDERGAAYPGSQSFRRLLSVSIACTPWALWPNVLAFETTSAAPSLPSPEITFGDIAWYVKHFQSNQYLRLFLSVLVFPVRKKSGYRLLSVDVPLYLCLPLGSSNDRRYSCLSLSSM